MQCDHCNGTGLVSCYSPLVVAGARSDGSKVQGIIDGRMVSYQMTRNGRLNRGQPMAVPCRCSFGDRHATWVDPREKAPPRDIPRFGSSRWQVPLLPYSAELTDEDHIAHIRSYRHPVEQVPGYVEEFAEWNES